MTNKRIGLSKSFVIILGTIAASTTLLATGCEEKNAEPAKTATEGASKAAETANTAAADAAGKTNEAAKDAGTKATDAAASMTETAKGAAAGAADKAAELAKVAMEKIDSGMKSARSTLDELKKKADGASPLVKPVVTPLLEKAETTYASLAEKVKSLSSLTDAGAKDKATGEVTTGLDSLNQMLADIKSKLGM
ncbi:MAG: hypothetical protein SFY96_10000 [Planctomycetota bacterium]|nr:hypothetical protein [Planctomycetota bacterium]